jgi:hypothetical protein
MPQDRLRLLDAAPRRLALAVAVAVCLVSLQCSRSPTAPNNGPVTGGNTPPPVTGGPGPSPQVPFVFVGAGDVANCDNNAFNGSGTAYVGKTWRDASEKTAQIIDSIGGEVFTLGDNAYPLGRTQDFTPCYTQTWGRFVNRTHPSPGNHDYGDRQPHDGSPYFNYFGAAAGDFGKGYYSFDRGGWHIISLNSNRDNGIDTGPNSAQATWLRQDLAANTVKCTLAYWHHPLFSSGGNGSSSAMKEIYRILHEAGADVVLTGHDHLYERFAPQDADGRPDQARGIVQFVVGTGGTVPMSLARSALLNSVVRITERWGVLKLTLNTDTYSWEFITTANGTLDTGSASCH